MSKRAKTGKPRAIAIHEANGKVCTFSGGRWKVAKAKKKAKKKASK